jgi:sulfur-carrier protein
MTSNGSLIIFAHGPAAAVTLRDLRPFASAVFATAAVRHRTRRRARVVLGGTAGSMSIRILYFAKIRDLIGKAEEDLALPDGVKNLSDLAGYLVRLHPALRDNLGSVRFARNEVFASLSEPIAEGDTVAVIPPVAGG